MKCGLHSPLDLEGLLWIDDRATEILRELKASGTLIMNASPYVALRLKSNANHS